jgi:hypothetical protein
MKIVKLVSTLHFLSCAVEVGVFDMTMVKLN